MLLDPRVSADRAVWHPPHTGGKPGLFQEPRRNPERDGLSAGGRWIRTSSTAAREPIATAFRPPAADRNLARAGRFQHRGFAACSTSIGPRTCWWQYAMIAGRRSKDAALCWRSGGRSSRSGWALRRGERAGAVLAHQAAIARRHRSKDRRQRNLLHAAFGNR